MYLRLEFEWKLGSLGKEQEASLTRETGDARLMLLQLVQLYLLISRRLPPEPPDTSDARQKG